MLESGHHKSYSMDQILLCANFQHEEGKMVMAGAVGDPIDGGVLIFQNCTKEVKIPILQARVFLLYIQ